MSEINKDTVRTIMSTGMIMAYGDIGKWIGENPTVSLNEIIDHLQEEVLKIAKQVIEDEQNER